MAKVIIQLCPFTVFIHVHFQTLLQAARSALVSVSFVYGAATLYKRETEWEEKRRGLHTAGFLSACTTESLVLLSSQEANLQVKDRAIIL